MVKQRNRAETDTLTKPANRRKLVRQKKSLENTQPQKRHSEKEQNLESIVKGTVALAVVFVLTLQASAFVTSGTVSNVLGSCEVFLYREIW